MIKRKFCRGFLGEYLQWIILACTKLNFSFFLIICCFSYQMVVFYWTACFTRSFADSNLAVATSKSLIRSLWVLLSNRSYVVFFLVFKSDYYLSVSFFVKSSCLGPQPILLPVGCRVFRLCFLIRRPIALDFWLFDFLWILPFCIWVCLWRQQLLLWFCRALDLIDNNHELFLFRKRSNVWQFWLCSFMFGTSDCALCNKYLCWLFNFKLSNGCN